MTPGSAAAAVTGFTIAVGCAACAPDRAFGPLPTACRERLPEHVYEHACQHGQFGPYQQLAAFPSDTTPLPSASAPQRALVIQLPPHALDQDGIAYVSYVPSRDGAHAVFSGADGLDVPIAVHDAQGQLIEAVPIAQGLAPDECGGMGTIIGVELDEGATYELAIGPTSADHATLFVEHLGSFSASWTDTCGL